MEGEEKTMKRNTQYTKEEFDVQKAESLILNNKPGRLLLQPPG
jgi:hypothetical protein